MPISARAKEMVIDIVFGLLDVIREFPDGVPSGYLYANLCGSMDINTYQRLIRILVVTGRITEHGHLLKPVPQPN